MIQQIENAVASRNSRAQSSESLSSFTGFEPLNSNHVYCPNQFFDICLKTNSRGMVRVVAYILRQTLGWLDENGLPVHQTVKVSYRDLIEKAGVSRGAITEAIQRAEAIGFIECRVAGSPKRKSMTSQTAEYTLRWDTNAKYAKTIDGFGGFFAGDGNRTPVPNAFFDQIIPNETLAVSKVVGAVIRHTVGYQNQFGRRRLVTPLSCTYIQNYTRLKKRNAVIDAIRHSEESGYIHRVAVGKFSPVKSEQIASTYSIRWLEKAGTADNGSKKLPEGDQSKKVTSNGSGKLPGDRFKKVTSIETTKQNDIFKQQAVADFDLTVSSLVEAGFQIADAKAIVEKRGVKLVRRQLEWIDTRKPENKPAMLRKAIENDWDEPKSLQAKRQRTIKNDRLSKTTVKLQQQDQAATEQKRKRMNRKLQLLKEWGTASYAQRAQWISVAVENQTGERLRNIIRKQSPESETPGFHILDAVANDIGLPAIAAAEELQKLPKHHHKKKKGLPKW